MNVKKPVTPAATVKTAAETDATSRATSKALSPAFRANRARISDPSSPAAARLKISVVVGKPQRTTGPASAITSGAAPPPYAREATITTTATVTSVAGPIARSRRESIPSAYARERGASADGRSPFEVKTKGLTWRQP
jgi:hypothetical protein